MTGPLPRWLAVALALACVLALSSSSSGPVRAGHTEWAPGARHAEAAHLPAP